jgi:DNA-binding NtrC family response regulator
MAHTPISGTLLVIDDDAPSCRLVKAIFEAEGLKVVTAQDGQSGLAAAESHRPDIALVDLQMPDVSGFDVLERLNVLMPGITTIMLTGSKDLRNAVKAMRLGAFDYLTKPMNQEEVVLVVRRALENRALREEVQDLRRHVGRSGADKLASQMGSSEQIKRVIEQVSTVAASNFTVLVLGETGTGKEVVSQAIHELSERRKRPFVALDCGAIPDALLESELFGHEKGAFTGADRRKEGRFRLAEGGTCFLDEMGNLPLNLQAKLLRVLESGQVQSVGSDRATSMDVRFIAATNQDLEERISRGAFRPDLYFRLAQYEIRLPALRERPDDIDYLARRFMEEASVELRRPMQTIVPAALDLLRRHTWPGNVRELRNVVRQSVLQTQGLAVAAEAVQSALRSALGVRHARAAGETGEAGPPQSLREVAAQATLTAERQAILEALRASGGNKSEAARALKTDYKTLHIKMKQMGIRAADVSS